MNPTRCRALLVAVSLAVFGTSARGSVASTTPFFVRWTAPGDDGLVGRAAVYDLRYSSVLITAANFDQATRILGLPVPAVAGKPESLVVSGLLDGVLYYLALKSADERGNWSGLSNVMTRPGQTAKADSSALAFSISSPWPNPARGSVHWAYSMPDAAGIQVDVFDVTGRHVHTVASGQREAGKGGLTWDLRDERGGLVGAGLYFVKARVGPNESTRRLIVVR